MIYCHGRPTISDGKSFSSSIYIPLPSHDYCTDEHDYRTTKKTAVFYFLHLYTTLSNRAVLIFHSENAYFENTILIHIIGNTLIAMDRRRVSKETGHSARARNNFHH